MEVNVSALVHFGSIYSVKFFSKFLKLCRACIIATCPSHLNWNVCITDRLRLVLLARYVMLVDMSVMLCYVGGYV